MAEFFKVSLSGASGREAVVEERSASAWFFMSGPGGSGPIACCYLYDTGGPAADEEPPPLDPRFASGYRVRMPVSDDDVEILWSAEGDAAAVRIHGEIVAFLDSENDLGFSRSVAEDCDWAHPFDVERFRKVFDLAD